MINRIRNSKKSWLSTIFLFMTFTAILVCYTAPSKYRYGDVFIFLFCIYFVWEFFRCVRRFLPINGCVNSFKNEALGLIKLHSVFIIQAIFILWIWVAGLEIDGEVSSKFLWGIVAYLIIFFSFTNSIKILLNIKE